MQNRKTNLKIREKMPLLRSLAQWIVITLFFCITQGFSQTGYAEFPFGESTNVSPDGLFELKTKGCKLHENTCDRKLWLVNNRTKA
jgi:hypothetical protein